MAYSHYLRERQREQKIQELQSKQASEIREMEFKTIDSRAENRRFIRRLHHERQEAEMEDKIMKANESEMMRRSQLEQEEKLAQQLDHMKREDMRKLKYRQLLRENCMELRELEAKLHAAYCARELCAQRAEKKTAELEEKLYNEKVSKAIKDSLAYEQELELKKKEEGLHQKFAYRQELQDQLICAEKKRQKLYYDFLMEKRLIDQITAKLLEEDNKIEEERLLKVKKNKKEMDEYMKAREEEKKKRKVATEEEDRRYLAYLEQKAMEEDEMKRKIRERNEMRDHLRFQLGKKLYDNEIQKLEHAEMLEEIEIARAREQDEKQMKAQMEEKIQKRLHLMQANRQQAHDRYQKLCRELEEDRLWREQMMAQFAADEKIEQLTAQKRWEKQQEHRRAVEKLLEDRRVARAAEMQRLLKEHEQYENEEMARKKIIEEERLSMLKEHAIALLGYLPRGVIREEDLPHLGCDLSRKLAAMNCSEEEGKEK